jgi:YegS/Rv2252/BmrU family lipid kinase
VTDSYKLIFNPVAGTAKKGKASKRIENIKSRMSDLGLDYDMVETEFRYHAPELVNKAKEDGYSTVIALGGDGTAHEVGNGAIQTGLKFGVINIGSGNDFASAIGLKSWEDAVDTLAHGKVHDINVLKSGDRYSINIMDSGLGSDVVKSSETRLRWMAGQFKYTLLTMGNLLKHKTYPVTITIDDKEEVKYNLNIIALGFGQSFGSGLNILPEARYNHDKMTIGIIHSSRSLRVLKMFPSLFDGSLAKYKDHVSMLNAKKVELRLDENHNKTMNIEAEGEIFNTVNSDGITIEVIEKALKVIMPQEWNIDNRTLKAKQDKT